MKYILILRVLHQSGKWGWFAYMPPEARGAMIATITDIMSMPLYASNSDLRQLAAFSINELIGTTQAAGHQNNTLDRITTAMGDVPGRNASEGAIKAPGGYTVCGRHRSRHGSACQCQRTDSTPLHAQR